MSKPHQGGVKNIVRETGEAGFGEVRQQISDLDSAIVELRATADRLLESAAERSVLAVVEPPASNETAPQHADSDAAPVWPRLATYEPQHGASGLASDDGAFGAPSAKLGTNAEADTDATVLEFAPRQPTTESEPTAEPTNGEDRAGAATGMPADWNTAGEDDAAIEKFFSADVEPEPAQRWLLND